MLNFSSVSPFTALVRIPLTVFLLALRLSVTAQAPAWQSARAVAVATAAVAGNSSVVTSTAIDATGNVFLAGYFRNSVVLGGTTLTSLGNYDVFVVKFNPISNQFVWAQRAGGTGSDYATALAVSGANVYVAGAFGSSTAGFGTINLANAGNSGVDFTDVFVAKLTDAGSTGNFAWAQRAGGVSIDRANALAVSGTSVYVAGGVAGPTADFGTITLVPAGNSDVFVAKLTDAGNTSSFVWAQRAGGVDNEIAYALAVSGTSLFVTGDFESSTAGFGPAILTNAGINDVFVTKLVDSGSTSSFVWAQRAGGTGEDYAYALCVSGTSVYIAGGFISPTAGFGPTTLTNAGANNGTNDVFVSKLTDAGSFSWAQRAGGTSDDIAGALFVKGTSVYIAGYFENPAAGFGPTTLTSAGSGDVFVAKLTDAGSFGWAQRAGGTRYEVALALAVSGTSVYVSGSLGSPTADFGTTILPNPNPGTTIGFLATLTDPTLTATTVTGPREPATLFPNPARRTATLRLPAGAVPTPLALTDALGRAVRHYPAPAGPDAVLDLRGLPAGLYLLRGAGPAQRLVVE